MYKYQEQYERVIRWYKEFKQINGGIIHNKDSNYYKDRIYAFYLNCYHLKDWIKNDPNSNKTEQEVEDFINDSFYLSLCGDICNALKHLTLKAPKIDKNIKIGNTKHCLNIGSGNTIYSAKYVIKVCGKQYDAFKIATHCIEDLNKFLNIKI